MMENISIWTNVSLKARKPRSFGIYHNKDGDVYNVCRNTAVISAIHNMFPGVKRRKHKRLDNGKTADRFLIPTDGIVEMTVTDTDTEMYNLFPWHPENLQSLILKIWCMVNYVIVSQPTTSTLCLSVRKQSVMYSNINQVFVVNCCHSYIVNDLT